MKLEKVLPRILSKEIKYIYQLESDGGGQKQLIRNHLPDGTFDLIINLGEPIRSLIPDYMNIRSGSNFIGGYCNSFHAIYPPNTRLLCVIFRPGYSSLFIKEDLQDLAGHSIDAKDLFGCEIDLLIERLRALKNIEEMGMTIEQFLIRRLYQNNNFHTERIAHASDQIDLNLDITVSELSDLVCMSERNFRRVFIKCSGYKPLEYIKIKKVKKLIKYLNEGKILRHTAKSLSYYDTSHLIKDFKLVANTSPRRYMEQLTHMDHAFLKDSSPEHWKKSP